MVNNHCLDFLPDYYNHRATVAHQKALFVDGNPIPWMTYPAISYLNQLDFSKKKIFEYGSGMSTLYWSSRAQSVISVEDNEDYYNSIKRMAPGNVDLFLLKDSSYVEKISYNAPHDVIVIDGRWRYDCGMNCLKFLRPGGLIILDNSERHPPIARFFRQHGLIEVDMIGYGPINNYIWSTSLFFSPGFNIHAFDDYQPRPSPGMVEVNNQETIISYNQPGSIA